MSKHVHEWAPIDTNFGEIEEAEWFICEHCPAILSREDVCNRLNEYDKLKRATDALSAELALTALHYVEEGRGKMGDALRAYADTLEGKSVD